jgi:GTPase SAR1 family protein
VKDTGQTAVTPGDLPALLDRASRLFVGLERPDLAATMQTALGRLRRPDTVVAVVGEFKQGKSSLINALLGASLSPVDDDLATAAMAWFRYRSDPLTRLHTRRDGERHSEDIAADAVAEYLTEAGNPGNSRGVDLVEFGVPNPVLERGLSLLDTPGTDGIDGAVGRTVLDYLPTADGLIFVTDASAELNAVELKFLAEAARRCPNVVVALTKIDLYPEWRRINDVNADHLGSLADVPVVPVSSTLRAEALKRAEAALNDESGVPELMTMLRRRILDDSKQRSSVRARDELQQAIGLVRAGLQAQRAALADTAAAQRSVEELEAARGRLEQIRKAGSRWSTLLSDGITDLNQATDQRLRIEFRRLLEEADEVLGSQDPAAVWDDYAPATRQAVTDLAGAVTGLVAERTGALGREVADQLGEDAGIGLDLGPRPEMADDDAGFELPESKFNPFSSVLTGLRGGSSGIILLGMIGRLAGLALATPVSVGVGVVFGAKQVMDERKRLLEKRRQEARTAARRYLSQAQTDLSAGVREQIKDAQRALRDEVSERLNQLNETYTTTIRSIETGLRQADEQRRTRVPRLDQQLGELDAIMTSSGAAGS